MNEQIADRRQRLVEDLKAVIADAEELLGLSATEAGEGAVRLRERVQERLAHVKEQLADAQDSALERARAAGRVADDFVHDRPWQALGAAAGIGLLLGLLLGRR